MDDGARADQSLGCVTRSRDQQTVCVQTNSQNDLQGSLGHQEAVRSCTAHQRSPFNLIQAQGLDYQELEAAPGSYFTVYGIQLQLFLIGNSF